MRVGSLVGGMVDADVDDGGNKRVGGEISFQGGLKGVAGVVAANGDAKGG